MALLAGLDVGTSSVKGLLVDSQDGRVVARAEAAYTLSTPQPGWAEQDPEDWWDGTQAVLAVLGSAGEIAGIGLTGQMHGLVALGADERVLRPAILWNDGRSGAQCAEIEQIVGPEALIAQTGNRALAGFTAPKLRWLAQREPDVYARIAHVLLPKDYVRLRLCGEHATDVADASGTLLFDVARRRWSDAVMQALEVDPAWFARALESPYAQRDHRRRRAGRRRRRRPGGRRARRRRRPARAGVGRARHVRRRVRRLGRLRGRPHGARTRLLPCSARRLAQHGRDAVGRRLAALAARHVRARRRLHDASSPRPSAGRPASRG